MRDRFGPPIRSTAASRITRSAIGHCAAPRGEMPASGQVFALLTGRVADPTLFGLIGIDPPPTTVGLPGARVADPTLFGLSGIDPPPTTVGLPGRRGADPALFGLAGVNPAPSAVGRRALSINGCCRKEDGSSPVAWVREGSAHSWNCRCSVEYRLHLSSLDLFAGRLALLGPRSNDNLTACSYGAGTGQFVVALRKLNVHDIPHRESADRPQRSSRAREDI